jgi:phosphotriesterase-related protein
MSTLYTTLGPKKASELGLILPHEHVFVDLGPIEAENWRRAEAEAVIALMGPELEAAARSGVTAVVECTPVGVGRRVDIVRAVSEAVQMPLVVATGIYREPWVPEWAVVASEDEVANWMYKELTDQIAGTGVRAAWIKLSAGDDGITPVEAKLLRAAARAGQATNAVIGSHTIQGRVVRDQLDILEEAGYTPDRFIWIHTQAEPDFSLHLEMAARGAWLEYDAIGAPEWTLDDWVTMIQRVVDAGYAEQLLLSHDRGWYDPSQPGGGVPKPMTVLTAELLPRLRAQGMDAETTRLLTETNPFHAFAR